MFGARVVRQKRERERAERDLLDLDSRLVSIIIGGLTNDDEKTRSKI